MTEPQEPSTSATTTTPPTPFAASTSSSAFEIKDLPTVFADIEPVPQDDGPTAVCRIDYPPQFAQAFDYFRALLHRHETSPRALRLTALCLGQNPANYTVWHYRRLVLYAQAGWSADDDDDKALLEADLQLAARLGGDNPKNYQIWYHRRAILVEFAKQGGNLRERFAESELTYVATVLEVDGKNYHAWSHRQWLLSTLRDESLWQQELAYTDRLLSEQYDVRNNSAWNQRWFVIHRGKTTRRENRLDVETACAEADYALDKAAKDPYNESPFSYFLALVKELATAEQQQQQQQWKTELLPALYEKVAALQSREHAADPSPHVLSTRFELLQYLGDADSIATAQSLLDVLMERVDPIRQKYWALRKSKLVPVE